jgi:hypothetical protein
LALENVSRKYFVLVIIVIETVEELIVPHAIALGTQHFNSKNLVVNYFSRFPLVNLHYFIF